MADDTAMVADFAEVDCCCIHCCALGDEGRALLLWNSFGSSLEDVRLRCSSLAEAEFAAVEAFED